MYGEVIVDCRGEAKKRNAPVGEIGWLKFTESPKASMLNLRQSQVRVSGCHIVYSLSISEVLML